MTTELLLPTGTETWEEVEASITASLSDLLAGTVDAVTISVPQLGKTIDARRAENGELQLIAAGNDSLQGANRLTVRDERAVIAVGFSVASESWGTFQWDWSAPVDARGVASGILRTMRDIYKTSPQEVEVAASILAG